MASLLLGLMLIGVISKIAWVGPTRRYLSSIDFSRFDFSHWFLSSAPFIVAPWCGAVVTVIDHAGLIGTATGMVIGLGFMIGFLVFWVQVAKGNPLPKKWFPTERSQWPTSSHDHDKKLRSLLGNCDQCGLPIADPSPNCEKRNRHPFGDQQSRAAGRVEHMLRSDRRFSTAIRSMDENEIGEFRERLSSSIGSEVNR